MCRERFPSCRRHHRLSHSLSLVEQLPPRRPALTRSQQALEARDGALDALLLLGQGLKLGGLGLAHALGHLGRVVLLRDLLLETVDGRGDAAHLLLELGDLVGEVHEAREQHVDLDLLVHAVHGAALGRLLAHEHVALAGLGERAEVVQLRVDHALHVVVAALDVELRTHAVHEAPSTASGYDAIVILATACLPGRRCQSSSVTNGIIGCSRRRPYSRQMYNTCWAVALASASSPANTGFASSRYTSHRSYSQKLYSAFVRSPNSYAANALFATSI
uniref:Uncharacterized protein n=1 Tax=Globisporangium ultimum (strain ATCC 200006 / CBS 805.95 / DAOM BR144) TaxID=431595 RepID=K3WUG4_GLOUD